MSSSTHEPFYSQGLRFTCQQCDNCCRGGQPGFVYPSRREIERTAHWLELPLHTFRHRFLAKDSDDDVIFRMKPNGDCIFWDQGCSVYPVRPRQCRTYPFWTENLESPETWEEVKKNCQGAGQGRLYGLDEIRSILKGKSTSPAR